MNLWFGYKNKFELLEKAQILLSKKKDVDILKTKSVDVDKLVQEKLKKLLLTWF